MSISAALESISKTTGDLFVVEFPGNREIIFRLPTYRQASQYALLINLAGNNTLYLNLIFEHIFSECVEDKYLAYSDNDMPAGIPESLAKAILFLSGVMGNSRQYTEELFSLYRTQSEGIIQYMKRFICATFPGYKLSDLESVNYQELVSIFIQAEKLLIDRGIIEKEHKFMDEETKKVAPKSIGDMIRRDASAYNDFENPEQGPRLDYSVAAKERAQREEAQYRQAMIGRYRR